MGGQPLGGFLKFFRKAEYLDQLLDGTLYCNTPEFYRTHREPGRSDPYESCVYSYRPERGDSEPAPVLRVIGEDGKEQKLPVIGDFTVWRGGKDQWLHCWFRIGPPAPDKERASRGTASMVQDLLRVRSEFGPHYAFLPAERLRVFVSRLTDLVPIVTSGAIAYSKDSGDWSPVCKSTRYAYQREHRFLLGECPESSKEPLVLTHPKGFRDLLVKHVIIQIGDERSVYFELRPGQEPEVDKDWLSSGLGGDGSQSATS